MTTDCEELPPRSPSGDIYVFTIHCSACTAVQNMNSKLSLIPSEDWKGWISPDLRTKKRNFQKNSMQEQETKKE